MIVLFQVVLIFGTLAYQRKTPSVLLDLARPVREWGGVWGPSVFFLSGLDELNRADKYLR